MSSILVCSGTELLGDGLMKLPFLHAVRQAWPQAHVTWLAVSGPTVFAGVLAELVRPYLDEVIEDARLGARWRTALRRLLPGRRFDLILDTQRRFRTTVILRRIRHEAFVSGAVGFLLSDYRPGLWHRKDRHMVDAMLRLVTVAGGRLPHASPTLSLSDRLIAMAEAALPGGGYVGIAPGAGGAHKCWPLQRFLEVGRTLAAAGYRPVFLLGPAEAAMTAAVRAGCPDALLPLQDAAVPEEVRASPLFTLVCAARLQAAVANDSGIGHLLAAANVPLLSLFGPTPAEKFAPRVAAGHVLRAQGFGGHGMSAIPADAVLAALRTLLA